MFPHLDLVDDRPKKFFAFMQIKFIKNLSQVME